MLKTVVGKKVLSYLISKAIDAAPSPNPTQSGIAGAMPAPDTAPPMGAPREADDVHINPPGMVYLNDWDSPLFHMTNNQSMADVTNEQMQDGHGTNGTAYRRG